MATPTPEAAHAAYDELVGKLHPPADVEEERYARTAGRPAVYREPPPALSNKVAAGLIGMFLYGVILGRLAARAKHNAPATTAQLELVSQDLHDLEIDYRAHLRHAHHQGPST